MSSDRIKRSDSNADKLRQLLYAGNEKSPIDYVKSKHKFEETPDTDDLVRLIQSVENVNHELIIENKYLKDEHSILKSNLLKLIEENSLLHKELKNVTVLEILNELNSNAHANVDSIDNNNQHKNMEEELHQSQLLINELQKKLELVLSKNNRTINKSMHHNGVESNTMDNIDSDAFRCCSKCTEEIEIKNKQIDNLKNENEQLLKTKSFMRAKLDEMENRENDLVVQIRKYVDLVKILEVEKQQAEAEKEIFKQDKLNTDKKFEDFMNEFNEKITNEKETILKNVDKELKNLIEQNQNLEEKAFKQENLIDRLTRDKVSLISECESYKNKCNSIDFDTHQMAEKLRIKYMDALKERDNLLSENKRVRHDYDLYIKQNDQDKFCLREELNTTRNRLLEVEKDLLYSKEQSIQLTEEINKLQTEIILLKHSKESVESARNENIKKLNDKYQEREFQLASGIESLQARYCVTVKELEDLIEAQKKLLNQLRNECKLVNEQLELLAVKYKTDTGQLKNQCEELTIRLCKYEERVKEFEEQNAKHNELHDKMKARLKDLTMKLQDQQDIVHKTQSTETLMRTTNLQLLQEISALKEQLKMFTIPSRSAEMNQNSKLLFSEPFSNINKILNESSRIDANTLNSVRSAIENSIYSLKSK